MLFNLRFEAIYEHLLFDLVLNDLFLLGIRIFAQEPICLLEKCGRFLRLQEFRFLDGSEEFLVGLRLLNGLFGSQIFVHDRKYFF